MGSYNIAAVGTSSKSRNINPGTFKTTASIGSTKGIDKAKYSNPGAFIEGTSLKASTIKSSQNNPMIMTID